MSSALVDRTREPCGTLVKPSVDIAAGRMAIIGTRWVGAARAFSPSFVLVAAYLGLCRPSADDAPGCRSAGRWPLFELDSGLMA